MILKLDPGQRAIVFAEVKTGIVLNAKGERDSGLNMYYRVFDSEQEAIAFAQDYIDQNPEIECSIRNENGEHLMFLRKES